MHFFVGVSDKNRVEFDAVTVCDIPCNAILKLLLQSLLEIELFSEEIKKENYVRIEKPRVHRTRRHRTTY